MKTLTHNEGKPLRKPILVYWDQCDPNCPGWGHFESNYGDDIERCDDCARFEDDDEAQSAHAEECGCAWGKQPDPKLCAYSDCKEQHPVAREDSPVTCPTCRAWLGLNPLEEGPDPANCPDCAAPNNNAEPGRCAECEA